MLIASQLSRSGGVIRDYFFAFFGFFFSFRMPVPFAMCSPPLLGLSSDYRCPAADRRTGRGITGGTTVEQEEASQAERRSSERRPRRRPAPRSAHRRRAWSDACRAA